jgi:hypothetical protein
MSTESPVSQIKRMRFTATNVAGVTGQADAMVTSSSAVTDPSDTAEDELKRKVRSSVACIRDITDGGSQTDDYKRAGWVAEQIAKRGVRCTDSKEVYAQLQKLFSSSYEIADRITGTIEGLCGDQSHTGTKNDAITINWIEHATPTVGTCGWDWVARPLSATSNVNFWIGYEGGVYGARLPAEEDALKQYRGKPTKVYPDGGEYKEVIDPEPYEKKDLPCSFFEFCSKPIEGGAMAGVSMTPDFDRIVRTLVFDAYDLWRCSTLMEFSKEKQKKLAAERVEATISAAVSAAKLGGGLDFELSSNDLPLLVSGQEMMVDEHYRGTLPVAQKSIASEISKVARKMSDEVAKFLEPSEEMLKAGVTRSKSQSIVYEEIMKELFAQRKEFQIKVAAEDAALKRLAIEGVSNHGSDTLSCLRDLQGKSIDEIVRKRYSTILEEEKTRLRNGGDDRPTLLHAETKIPTKGDKVTDADRKKYNEMLAQEEARLAAGPPRGAATDLLNCLGSFNSFARAPILTSSVASDEYDARLKGTFHKISPSTDESKKDGALGRTVLFRISHDEPVKGGGGSSSINQPV